MVTRPAAPASGPPASGVSLSSAVEIGDELEAQRALVQRPHVSIAARIAASFCVLFGLMAGITVTAVVLISNLRAKQGFLEKAANYEFEIQQARRYEKNFFLYGTNLGDALTSVHIADASLDRNQEELRSVIGESRFGSLRENLGEYERNLEELDRLRRVAAAGSGEERLHIESQLRRYGAQTVADAQEMVDSERIAMHALLRTSMVAAFAFLVFMLFTMALVAAYVTRTVLQPVKRFMAYTQRIGAGDYSPILPVRRYRDEFSNLAMAINEMLHELKLYQERLVHSEKMIAVGTLTAGIAHELNNPLNNISLTIEALLEDFASLSEEDKLRMLDQADTQVARASSTVRQLLDFTRKEDPVLTSVALPRLIESTLKLVGNELALAQVEVRRQVADPLPPVTGNPRSLQQVLLNLFLNAIQAMPEGGTLTVAVEPDGDAGVVLDVSDTGVGIPAGNMSKIFDPFFSTKEEGHGTGLGLTVSYGIIEKHKGRITVRSEEGRGTTFSVFLPVDRRH